MIIVGLTGSIAMGKSTVSAMFAELGVPTFDADDAVRDFYAGDGAKAVEAAFPGVVVSGQVDRERLGARVLGDAEALQRLEGLVHPAVGEARSRFLERTAAAGRRIVVVDVPLLFETGGEANVDLIIVVSAPESIQRARALARAGMTEAKLDAILSRQTPDAEKRRRRPFRHRHARSARIDARRRRLNSCARSGRWREGERDMREMVLDTETTGLDPADGHRVLEIGAVEIVHQSLTGNAFHVLINPERDVPEDAVRVHGHTAAILKDKPVFASIVDDFLAFIGDSNLVIHNADFDMRFVNAELARLGLAAIGMERVVDTLTLARKKHPGQPNSLDALCDRYRIDRTRRVRHGALLDAEILVEVYCELMGGRQRSLMFGEALATRRRAPRRVCSALCRAAAKATFDRPRRGERSRSIY